MKKINIPLLLAFLVIPQLAGVLGTFFTVSSIPTWYSTLEKPWFTPPNWLFGPVWVTLYLLIGISGYIIYMSDAKQAQKTAALSVFVLQMVLNAIWTPLFFGFQSPLIAFVEIVTLWLAIAWMIWLFAKISKTAAWLLVPYILWVTLASALNLSILLLN